ncbi:MAG TPA: M20/M25/M40 family metallo-hydrolase [Gemmataceae bacterium]|nr:M20/M25/M40 family metallo-hydrolase [Gemmataceae bacterium]
MKAALDWLAKNHDSLVRSLADLVAIPSISTDGEHQKEVEQTAALTCEQMRQAGLQNVEMLRSGDSNPYAFGEWVEAPGKPTIFLYAHHDVQPINFVEDWQSEPWTLTRRSGRLFGRGAADDKGAITAQLGAIAAFLQTRGSLPVNVKMVVEGEEEVGSSNLLDFFQEHKERIRSDVIVVNDTENIDVGIPSITYSLRGIVAVLVEVQSAKMPVHSGMAGGVLPDAALALDVVLSRLYWKNGKLPIPHFYDSVRPLTKKERQEFRSLPGDEAQWRRDYGLLPGTHFATEKNGHAYEQTWRKPAVTVIAQEASSIKGASNQVLPKAAAIVSCRIVPDQDPNEVVKQVRAFLTADPPWGVKVTVKQHGSSVGWWMTDPNGPAFEAALAAMRAGFKKQPVAIGCGGSIGFVGPLAELFGGSPALLLGIEDPKSNAHAPNESLHEGDWRKLMASLANLFENLGNLPDGRVK